MRALSAFFVGLIFGLGLVISQMVNPAKIIGFLDIAGDWDPSLLVVMGSALVTTVIGYRLVLSADRPLIEDDFKLPTKTVIDGPLLMGAGIFGVGWGLSGLCPGPGVSAAGIGGVGPLIFLAAMGVGMLAQSRLKL